PPPRLEERLPPLREARGLSPPPLEDLATAVDLLRAHPPLSPEAEIVVDLSLARGLRYYTGLVFEIYVDAADGPMQLCGGGRYDDLARALGSRDVVPACGFQIGLERLNLALPALATVAQPRVLVVGVTPQDHTVALALASELRSIDRVVVEQDVRLREIG